MPSSTNCERRQKLPGKRPDSSVPSTPSPRLSGTASSTATSITSTGVATASLPAVPPAKYTRHKNYFTENGQCLVKEYFLGFKYGQEIAIATGQRQLLTVPVLLPQEPTGPPAFIVTPAAAAILRRR